MLPCGWGMHMNQKFFDDLEEIKARGNVVTGTPIVDERSTILVEGSDSEIHFGENCRLVSASILSKTGNCRIYIGDGAHIRGSFRVESGSSLNIGSRTHFQRHSDITAIEGADITIGDRCLFSNVSIRSSDQHSIIDRKTKKRINPARSVIIEDRVWLSEFTAIQKGVTIGANSIVGAHAVVTRSFPRNCLIAGVPAKIVKRGVRWERSLSALPPLPASPYTLETQRPSWFRKLWPHAIRLTSTAAAAFLGMWIWSVVLTPS